MNSANTINANMDGISVFRQMEMPFAIPEKISPEKKKKQPHNPTNPKPTNPDSHLFRNKIPLFQSYRFSGVHIHGVTDKESRSFIYMSVLGGVVMAKSRKLSELLAASELGVTKPQVILQSDREAVLEGCKHILAYDDNLIHVHLRDLQIKLYGQNLSLQCLNPEHIVVTGRIQRLEYVR